MAENVNELVTEWRTSEALAHLLDLPADILSALKKSVQDLSDLYDLRRSNPAELDRVRKQWLAEYAATSGK